ncbi:putative polyprenyl synthase [Trypanosoma cruzi]|uniref:Polyprenyl synthase, putative n=2 Tax=Trypanosoma cruzi TaxID=5693 RepID=Q4DD12_TRYCC|nr:polyprenyl synthase, putative [Trypanosoma cruzi]EAN90414.1 polyprenyl synthase, putative [Trypanosoma cruzi]PWV17427.1 putative polyprenyl synthase [Trypanosoma cruzi]|eukprot:XP_812265.1 polyprenyl synthase [Trypanosoma cruzi strain CL Brener]
MRNFSGFGTKGENGGNSVELVGEPLLKPSMMDMISHEAFIQWWYFNAHLRDVDSEKEFSFFTSFFAFKDPKNEHKDDFYDACTWALIDVTEKKYYPDSLLDRRAAEFVIGKIEANEAKYNINEYPVEIVKELLKQGKVPLPDRLMEKTAVYDKDSLKINFNDEFFLEGEGDDAERRYKLHHHNPLRNITVELEFTARTIPSFHGDNGFIKQMFYYYYPSMSVEGKLTIGDSTINVKGDGWYDREYGSLVDDSKENHGIWNWFGLQLSNGYQLNLFELFDEITGKKEEQLAVLTSGEKRYTCRDFIIEPVECWTSLVTFQDYNVAFHIELPSFQLFFDLRASFKHQEFQTILTFFGFYEGRVTGEGSHEGTPVSIIGFYEQKNAISRVSTSSIINKLGEKTRGILSEVYPLHASVEWIEKNVLGRFCTCKGVLPQHICDTLFLPVRFLIDRGGKYWRTFFFFACSNALSRDYADTSKCIIITELGHVGSLIIDDIEDGSSVRRGGKAAHVEFGTPTAINAGTACFFMSVPFAGVNSLPAEKAKRFYELYFEMMKAAHAGQGLDIRGLGYLMPDVVRTGETKALEDAVKAIHTCKTGAICGAICSFACVLTDTSEEVTQAMEEFGKAIGLAYQIIDDVLGVKGFEGNLKEAGEDIRDGKITYPVAKAMGKLELPQRERIWSILNERTSDREKIEEALSLINSANVVDECVADALQLVEEEWKVVDPLIPDTVSKVMLRALCFYIIRRNH